MPLIAQPGAMFDYSNSSVDTLCRLVEVVSGLNYDTYQRRTSSSRCGCTRPDRIAAVCWAGRDEKQTEPFPLGLGMPAVHLQPAPDLD